MEFNQYGTFQSQKYYLDDPMDITDDLDDVDVNEVERLELEDELEDAMDRDYEIINSGQYIPLECLYDYDDVKDKIWYDLVKNLKIGKVPEKYPEMLENLVIMTNLKITLPDGLKTIQCYNFDGGVITCFNESLERVYIEGDNFYIGRMNTNLKFLSLPNFTGYIDIPRSLTSLKVPMMKHLPDINNVVNLYAISYKGVLKVSEHLRLAYLNKDVTIHGNTDLAKIVFV